MKYLNESFHDFVNEMAKMTPEEKKARRKQRRLAKKRGTKLPRLTKSNKATTMTPERLKEIIEETSPSSRIEWHHWHNEFYGSTGDRGPRTDLGGGENGDDWMSDEQIRDVARPYIKKWKPKAQQMQKDLKKKGITASVGVDYGEKGNVAIVVTIQQ